MYQNAGRFGASQPGRNAFVAHYHLATWTNNTSKLRQRSRDISECVDAAKVKDGVKRRGVERQVRGVTEHVGNGSWSIYEPPLRREQHALRQLHCPEHASW